MKNDLKKYVYTYICDDFKKITTIYHGQTD